jgi:hypothetical protein
VFDVNGDGMIDIGEAAALTWTLKHLPSCNGCAKTILPLLTHAYCCTGCIDDVKARHDQDAGQRRPLYGMPFGDDSDQEDDVSEGRKGGLVVNSDTTTFLCKKCHVDNKLGCRKHGTEKMEECHKRSLKQYVPAPAVLVIPGCEDNMHRCLCCEEKHSLVVSYLRPHLKDLHMRPMMANGPSGTQCCQKRL